jgi:hypothetical protein
MQRYTFMRTCLVSFASLVLDEIVKDFSTTILCAEGIYACTSVDDISTVERTKDNFW